MNNPFPKDNEGKARNFVYPISHTIMLEVPKEKKEPNLFQAIKDRSSIREFNPITVERISAVLWYSARIVAYTIQDNGYILSKRPSPSAGARHPIDIIVALPGSIREFFYYNPMNHTLNKLDLDANLASEFIMHINHLLDSASATIVWFIAHPDRTEAKYNNSESLIWRDAGALIYCFQLVCTALEVNSCPLGTLGDPYIHDLFKDYGHTFGVGGLLIG